MRSVIGLLIFAAASIVPRTGSAQVSVTSPAAGAQSSYRNTAISWNPIPGASSYHLEIDDDPNFGSPEVDVTVSGTSYTLSGQRLKLNGQQSWAAYVRINGTRWNASTFTPSYFDRGGSAGNAAVAVTSQNLVFLAFHDRNTRIHLTASSDWSLRKLLSLEDTFNADPVNLAVDEFDVAHAFWLEQRPTENPFNRVPYYTSSATGWDLVQGPVNGEGCSKGSSFAARGQFEIFMSCNNPNEITRWTITNGTQFAHAAVPNSANTDSATASRDGVGNVYVASTREGLPNQSLSVFQGSGDGWIPHTAAAGLRPTLTVTREGELHAVLLGWGDAGGVPFRYSNSLRGFQTWTELPGRSPHYLAGEVLPLVVDASRGRLYTAIRTGGAIQLCSAAHTGLTSSTGTSWTCVPVGDGDGMQSASALAPDGTVHFVWRDVRGVGYANSLGSFLATNFSPLITFGTPSTTPSAAIVPAAISDSDGDDLAGEIRVGQIQDVVSPVEPGATEPIFFQQYTIENVGSFLTDAFPGALTRLQFRVAGTSNWSDFVERSRISTVPTTVEVRLYSKFTSTVVGTFQILAWDASGVTISETDFVASVMLTYSGALPSEMDISSIPAGDTTIAIATSDGLTSAFGSMRFTKTAGQTRLLLTTP